MKKKIEETKKELWYKCQYAKVVDCHPLEARELSKKKETFICEKNKDFCTNIGQEVC